jgi:hypothetical protein
LFSTARDPGGISVALGALSGRLGMLGAAAGAVVGSLKFRGAATMLTLLDNRSGVQLAATEGNSTTTDFGAWGGLFGGGAPQAWRLYEHSGRQGEGGQGGGLGTGGRLGVQGGSTPASKALNQ